jgi:hypothetical protein
VYGSSAAALDAAALVMQSLQQDVERDPSPRCMMRLLAAAAVLVAAVFLLWCALLNGSGDL